MDAPQVRRWRLSPPDDPKRVTSLLRHPRERAITVFSIGLQIAVVVAAVLLVLYGSAWLATHPRVAKRVPEARALALALVMAPIALAFGRNTRRGQVRGNAVRATNAQYPKLQAILVRQCAILGMRAVPPLYVAQKVIPEPARACSTWQEDYIVVSAEYFEPAVESYRDVIEFSLARELGAIQLGHTRWWKELLLAHVMKVPWLRAPLLKVRTLSCDRYGAYLAPQGVRGLLVLTVGRRLVNSVDVGDWLRQVDANADGYERFSELLKDSPHVTRRVRALYDLGLFDREADARRFAATTPRAVGPVADVAPSLPAREGADAPALEAVAFDLE